MNHKHYMHLAYKEAEQSTCHKKRVGSIIVINNENTNEAICDKYIISKGYGGWIEECNLNEHGLCPRKVLTWFQDGCWSIHAEERALYNIPLYWRVPTYSFKSFKNWTIYITHGACDQCIKLLVFNGIGRIIYDQDYKTDYTKWLKYIEILKLEELNELS